MTDYCRIHENEPQRSTPLGRAPGKTFYLLMLFWLMGVGFGFVLGHGL
jgi:hypothetical protein